MYTTVTQLICKENVLLNGAERNLADHQIHVHKPFKHVNTEKVELCTSLTLILVWEKLRNVWTHELLMGHDYTTTEQCHLVAPPWNISSLLQAEHMAAILEFQSGAQPEMTCNQAVLLTTVCPGYVLFDVLYNEYSFFADDQLHQEGGSVEFLKHVSVWYRCLIDITK